MNNGLELLADETDPEMREQVLELLNDSARAAASKLKFFRLAFGAAGGYGAEIDTAEAKAALEGLVGAEGKIELGWMVAEPKLPKDAVKLLLNIAMIVGDGLVRGGRLDVGAEKGAGKLEMVIRGEGPRLMIDPAIRDVLANGADDVEPRTSAAYLAHSLAAREEGTIQISAPDDQHIVVGATLPE